MTEKKIPAAEYATDDNRDQVDRLLADHPELADATLTARQWAGKLGALEPKIDVDEFVITPAQAVPVAGLLADQPELRAQKHTRAQWDRKLDAYLNSERT